VILHPDCPSGRERAVSSSVDGIAGLNLTALPELLPFVRLPWALLRGIPRGVIRLIAVLDHLTGFAGSGETKMSTRKLGEVYEALTGDEKRTGFGPSSINQALQWADGKSKIKDDESEGGHQSSPKFIDRERAGGGRTIYFRIPFAKQKTDRTPDRAPRPKRTPAPTPQAPGPQQHPKPPAAAPTEPEQTEPKAPGWYRTIAGALGLPESSPLPAKAQRRVRSPEEAERDRQAAEAAMRRIEAANALAAAARAPEPPQRE
jgi:hypothetical protein